MTNKILRGLPSSLGDNSNKAEIDYVIFNLPYICDYSCRKCFLETTLSEESLNLEDRKRVLKEASDLGAKVALISGEGEPLITPHIKDIIKYQHKLGLTSVIFTNGMYLTKEIAKFGKDHDVSFIITLDSLDANVYNYLTRTTGNFDEVMRNIKNCRKLYQSTIEERENTKIVRLAINTVLTRQNKDEASKIRKWCDNDMIFICNYPVKEGNAIEFWDDLCGDTDQYAELREIASKSSETNGPSSTSLDGSCAYLHHGISINADGTIVLCHAARETKGFLGNVRNSSLKEIKKDIKQHLSYFSKEVCVVRDSKYSEFLKSLK
jgi:MoaA/NifB/PqqE/SkfB family radical SAM enzyme